MIQRCWELDPSARPSFSEISEDLRFQRAFLMLGQQGVGFCADDLEPATLISEGASGKVYRGNLQGRPVAIMKFVVGKQKEIGGSFLAYQKLIDLEMPVYTSARILRSVQTSKSRTCEFAIIPRSLQHYNLVELNGYLTNGSEWLQVNEFPLKGSLHNLLHGGQGMGDSQIRPILEWRDRVTIAHGAAKGLKSLHENLQPPVCYGNITSSSVWVFDDYTAKIQYLGHMSHGAGEECRVLREAHYGGGGEFTQQRDVFNFGLILVELFCGNKSSDCCERLLRWWSFYGEKEIWRLIDPQLGSKYVPKQAANMALLAAACLEFNADRRPHMSAALQLMLTQPSVELREGLVPSHLKHNSSRLRLIAQFSTAIRE